MFSFIYDSSLAIRYSVIRVVKAVNRFLLLTAYSTLKFCRLTPPQLLKQSMKLISDTAHSERPGNYSLICDHCLYVQPQCTFFLFPAHIGTNFVL